jgi:hypothetical protein
MPAVDGSHMDHRLCSASRLVAPTADLDLASLLPRCASLGVDRNRETERGNDHGDD